MKSLLIILGLCLSMPLTGWTQLGNNNFITVDLYGNGDLNGSPFNGVFTTDPTGGIINGNVLIYTLPFSVFSGDLEIDNVAGGGSDFARFFNNNQMIFYSGIPLNAFANSQGINNVIVSSGLSGGVHSTSYNPTTQPGGGRPSNSFFCKFITC